MSDGSLFRTGVDGIDVALGGGFGPGVHVVLARHSAGSTTLALQVTEGAIGKGLAGGHVVGGGRPGAEFGAGLPLDGPVLGWGRLRFEQEFTVLAKACVSIDELRPLHVLIQQWRNTSSAVASGV